MFINMLGIWIRGLIAMALLVGGGLLVREWIDELPREIVVRDGSGSEVRRPLLTFRERLAAWDPTRDRSTGLLAAGALLLIFTVAGRWMSPWAWRRGVKTAPTRHGPRVQRLKTRHGYELHVEIHGPATAPALVLVHGVGSDRTQWEEVTKDLSDRFRIIAFDLLGHGRSDHVGNAEHTLESAARDLNDVMALAGPEPVLLAGHSMGGMVALTWCLAHTARRDRLAGLILVHTTSHNPMETMAPVPLHRVLQKPLHEPVLRITPALSWFVRFMNLLDYMNGTTHWSNDRTMFGGSESRGQLERTARLHAGMDPAAVARFTLAMTRFDVRSRLSKVDVPTLVVAADQDGVTVPDASRDLVVRLPDAELLVLQKTRHMGFMERRREFADAIGQFYESGNTAEHIAER